MSRPSDGRHGERLTAFYSLLRLLWLMVMLSISACDYLKLALPVHCDLLILFLVPVLYLVAFNDLLGTKRYHRAVSRQQRR
jgi:hypothetical protein